MLIPAKMWGGRALPFLLSIGLFLAVAARAEKVEQLEPHGYVNDFASALDARTIQQLEALCKEVDEKTSAQIAVVTIHSLEGDSVEDFSVRLATKWGVGHKGDNRGVLILLAVNDRKYRVEVGYGLEPVLPDGKVGGFGREMVPLLRQGNYSRALLHLSSEIAQVVAADRGVALAYLPAEKGTPARPPEVPSYPASQGEGGEDVFLTLLLFALVAGLVGLGVAEVLRRAGGRPWGWRDFWATLFALLFSGRADGSWGGGSWGGGFGGSGFGGFGGGGFGGGGASGGW